MANELIIGGVSVAPGERTIIELQLGKLATHTDLHMPIHVIRGKKPGPILLVCAAIHGDKINGFEIIRRLSARITTSRLKGTLIAIPIVNVYGFIHRSRYLPDRRDLNRSFPGSPHGSMAAQLADTFMKEVVSKCTHGVDLHTGALQRENLPQIRANIQDERIKDMAIAFQAPIIIDSVVQAGTIRGAAADLDIPWIVYEAGEALRFDEVSIRAGVRGTLNVMRNIGLLTFSRKKLLEPRVARSSSWIRAQKSGVMRLIVKCGDLVKGGQTLGFIADPYGSNEAPLQAERDGIVVGRSNLPMVYQGEAVIHIARFNNISNAADSVEAFQNEIEPDWDEHILAPESAPII